MAIISNTDIARAIYMTTKDKTGSHLVDSLKEVVKFLARKRLLSRTNNILSTLGKIVNQEAGIVKAKVSSARKLHHETKTNLTHKLEKHYQAKEVIFEEIIDEKLLGGMRVEVEDEVIDLTLKNKINQLQAHLIRNA